MIQIDDKDMPIHVAEKIITATIPYSTAPDYRKPFLIFGNQHDTIDRFTIQEIKEIADYLMCYYNNNVNQVDRF